MLTKLLHEDRGGSQLRSIAVDRANRTPIRTRLHEVSRGGRTIGWRIGEWPRGILSIGASLTSRLSGRIAHGEREVFEATHALTLKWVSEGRLSGLRIDHIDGLRDPIGYLERLRTAAPNAWILAEKILADGEHLRGSWPIDGTSGYDFLNIVGRLMLDSTSAEPLIDFYRDFTGDAADFQPLVRAKKQLAMRGSLGSEINRLTARFLEVCEANILYRDHSRHELHEVLRAALACEEVYRTYAREPNEVSREDERLIAKMIASAK